MTDLADTLVGIGPCTPLDWRPWVEPVAEADLTERHIAALMDPARIRRDDFRLLARDPGALDHRTRTDRDIF